MRLAVLLFVLLLSATVSQAQQQERKLEDRIMRPDVTQGSREQNVTFQNYKTFQSSGSDRASVKDFYYDQKFSPKGFETKEFTTKNHWEGDFKFATTGANTKGRFVIPNASKNYDTKSLDVKDARENKKTYSSSTYATDAFHADGRTQKILDARYANQKPKTMDEIRELLNKNK